MFKNGREVSAWLGLVPKQHSSGNKIRLGGISKRGDYYVRTPLIHGARAFVNVCEKKTDNLRVHIPMGSIFIKAYLVRPKQLKLVL